MGKMPISAAAELAVQGSERLAAGLDDCEPRIELADWISENLQDDETLRQAKLLVRDAGSDALSYFTQAIRLAAGTVEITTNNVREYVVLVGMPIFLSGDPRPDGARVTDWGARQLVERYFENIAGLRMLSVRFATFPVDAISLGQLTPVQVQKMIRDLHTYGDSRLLKHPPLTFDGEENGFIWPAIIKFRVDSYVEDIAKFRASGSTSKFVRFRNYAARELGRCLVPMSTNSKVTVYPLVQLATSFSSYRLLKLTRVTRHILREKPDVRHILYRFKSGRLTMWFIGADACFEDVAEMDFGEDTIARVYDTLRYLQKRTGVQLEEVSELPAIPGEAARFSR